MGGTRPVVVPRVVRIVNGPGIAIDYPGRGLCNQANTGRALVATAVHEGRITV